MTEQAQGRVFQSAHRIVEASPLLRAMAEITQTRISFPLTGAVIQAVGSDYASAAGANLVISSFDELWAYSSERSHVAGDELVTSPKLDSEIAAHLEWLGFVRPTGLVVSVPALVRAGAILDRRDAEGQRLLRACVEERTFDPKEGPIPCIPDFRRRLAEQVLHALYELLRGFQAAHDASKGQLLREPLSQHPDEIYRAPLTVILRLVFLLYAEERNMLPSTGLWQ
jgi:hypothetical protein